MTDLLPEAPRGCNLCPRLVAYRHQNQSENPDWFNGPAPSFGDPDAKVIIVGLAPGRTGANRTGRPFTGDHAGILLYETLIATGFAKGRYGADPEDGLELRDCMITNAVRCAPPENKPFRAEEDQCRTYLKARLAALPKLRVIITLGDISRRNVLKALGAKSSVMAAGHGAEARVGSLHLLNSYHCSRLNTNTGRLTAEMFADIFLRARNLADLAPLT